MPDLIAKSSDQPRSLVLVGAGKMGGALLEGWLTAGLDPERLAVLDPAPSDELARAASASGFRLNAPVATLSPPEVLVLGVKPQALAAVTPGIRSLLGSETLLVSIIAGKGVADLRRACPEAGAVVRAMPNLPASIGRGATGVYAEDVASPRQRQLATALLSAVGIVEWVGQEDLVDAVTAVSGSGPAYVFHLVECLAAAACEVGLDAGTAERLARATVTGAGELLARSDLDPGELRRNVTSPGGTTEAALRVLAGEPGLRALLSDAVRAAKRRAEELAG